MIILYYLYHEDDWECCFQAIFGGSAESASQGSSVANKEHANEHDSGKEGASGESGMSKCISCLRIITLCNEIFMH